MVSLLISKLGKQIAGHTPDAIYEILKAHAYLSKKALSERPAAVMVLERVRDSWPARPPIGAEVWRVMEAALADGDFLNSAGLAAAREFVSRW
jgi:hypothetical protein